MDKRVRLTCARQPWHARLCRWLPIATLAALFIAWAIGYPVPAVAAVLLLLLCPIVCLILLYQSKEVEGQIAAAVEGRGQQSAD